MPPPLPYTINKHGTRGTYTQVDEKTLANKISIQHSI